MTISAFQSTPSAWRETYARIIRTDNWRHFNPLPPHGGRLFPKTYAHLCGHFNPLPPHGGRRMLLYVCGVVTGHFNPLPPHGGRPARNGIRQNTPHFNPLPPHGGRLFVFSHVICITSFQSTPSAWRETGRVLDWIGVEWISIHSLRMEGDERPHRLTGPAWRFQSTPSAWRETA